MKCQNETVEVVNQLFSDNLLNEGRYRNLI